jgi:DNA gyrase/topoisomerase IV subunit B
MTPPQDSISSAASPGTGGLSYLLPWYEALWQRPLAYVSSTDSHGIGDLVCYVLRYCFGGRLEKGGGATSAKVCLRADRSIAVTSDAAAPRPQTDESGSDSFARIFTQVYTGDWPGASLYIVNTLSSKLIITAFVNGQWMQQVFSGPATWSQLQTTEPLKDNVVMQVEFWPRANIFGTEIQSKIVLEEIDNFTKMNPNACLVIENMQE